MGTYNTAKEIISRYIILFKRLKSGYNTPSAMDSINTTLASIGISSCPNAYI